MLRSAQKERQAERFAEGAPALKRWAKFVLPLRGVAGEDAVTSYPSKIRISTKTFVYRNPIVLAEIV